MRCRIATLGLMILLCGLAIAQETAKKPAFEAADVHVSAAGATQDFGTLPNGRLEFHASTLLRLIAFAYSVQPDRVAGGPSWLDVDRFDVIAMAGSSVSQIAMRTMLQNLLAERFDLSI